MKNKEELEKIARKIVECRSLHLQTKDRGKSLIESITEALAKVQDEALNARLPSESTIEAEATARFGNPEMKINPEDLQWWRYKDAFKQGVAWLRANMKPQIPRAEIEKVRAWIVDARTEAFTEGDPTEDLNGALAIVEGWLK